MPRISYEQCTAVEARQLTTREWVRGVVGMLMAVLVASVTACDREPNSSPRPLSGGVSSRMEDLATQLQSQLQDIFGDRIHRGYGGRQFRIRFDSEPRVESESNERVTIWLMHWQVQTDASMKYELEIACTREQETWRLAAAWNRYLGMKDERGFRTAEGFKKLGALERVKGNVYADPIREAFAATLAGHKVKR